MSIDGLVEKIRVSGAGLNRAGQNNIKIIVSPKKNMLKIFPFFSGCDPEGGRAGDEE